MIKKLTFILLAAGCTQVMYAQSTEKNEKFLENKTLFEELTNVKKKQDKFNLFLNMQLRCKLPRRLRRGSFQNEATSH